MKICKIIKYVLGGSKINKILEKRSEFLTHFKSLTPLILL